MYPGQEPDRTSASRAFAGSVTEPPLDFASSDKDVNAFNLDQLFEQELEKISDDERPDSFFGLTTKEAKESYQASLSIEKTFDTVRGILHQTSQSDSPDSRVDQWSPEKLAAVQHLRNVQQILTGQVAPFFSELNGREDRVAMIKESLETAKKVGADADYINKLLPIIKEKFPFTPHNTDDLSDYGETEFYLAIMKATDAPPEEREDIIRAGIAKALRTRITPQSKGTILEEIDKGIRREKVYVRGQVMGAKDLQKGCDMVHPGQINIASAMKHTMLAETWFVSDADKKENADAAAYLVKIIGSMKSFAEINLEYLDGAHPSDIETLRPYHKVFEEIHASTNFLFEKREQLITETSNDKRGKINPLYEEVLEESKTLHKKIFFKGYCYDSEEELLGVVLDDLQTTLQDKKLHVQTQEALDSCRYILEPRVLSTVLHQSRHDAEILQEIFANLFEYAHDNETVEPGKGQSLTDFESTTFVNTLKLFNVMPSDKYRELLLKANGPDKGFAHQVLKRFFDVMAGHQNKMSIAIISESIRPSPFQQESLAYAAGIKDIITVPLSESRETVRRAAENINFVDIQDPRRHSSYFMMDCGSDIQKRESFIVKALRYQASMETTQWGYDHEKPVPSQWGGGFSKARNGCSTLTQPDLYLYKLMDMELLGQNPSKNWILKQEACTVARTMQGRAARLLFGTETQVANNKCDIFSKLLGVCLAIDGKVDPELIVPRPPNYSLAMRNALERAQIATQNDHRLLMTTRSNDVPGQTQMDHYLRTIVSLPMAKHLTPGARNGAKKANTPPTEWRAIGSDKLARMAGYSTNGCHGLGFFLNFLHQDYQAGRINEKDLSDLKSDPLRMYYIMESAVHDLVDSDFRYGFHYKDAKILTNEWSVKDVFQAAESGNIRWHDRKLTEIEEIQVKLAHDGVLGMELFRQFLQTPDQLNSQQKVGFNKTWGQIRAGIINIDSILEITPPTEVTNLFPSLEDVSNTKKHRRFDRAAVIQAGRLIDDGVIDPARSADILFSIGASFNSTTLTHIPMIQGVKGGFPGHRMEPWYKKAIINRDLSHSVDASTTSRQLH